jgi:hypothetical protein
VIAVDVNVVTLGLLATRIAFEIDAQAEDMEALDRIDLVHGDYLDQLKELYGRKRDGPVVAVGNPPYTRVQELSMDSRQKAREAAADIVDTGHANLAVLFQAATLALMKPQDVSCMVLPGSFSYTRAGHGLRRALWESDREVEIQRWPATQRAFTGRAVQAAVLTIGPSSIGRPPLRLARVELEDDSINVVSEWMLSRDEAEPGDWFWSSSESYDDTNTIPLSSIAAVRRGVATGANEMFFVDDATAARLPDDAVIRGVPSLRGFTEEALDERAHALLGGPNAKRWLLSIRSDRQLTGYLCDYISSFEEEVKDRHLPSKRKPWYSISPPPGPSLLIAPLSKSDFKVVINTVRAVPSNNLFGISLFNDRDIEGTAAWLRSSEGQKELQRVSRRYPGGSYKLEPASLAAIRVPSTIQLTTPELQEN